MEGLKDLLLWLNNNWSLFVICSGLAITLYQKFVKWNNQTTAQKIESAKNQLMETILKYISDAEIDYADYEKAGSIKRAEVIAQFYADFPILEKVVDQKELVQWFDDLIDSALPTLRKIIEESEKANT